MKKVLISAMVIIVVAVTAFALFMATGSKTLVSGYSLRCSNDTYMIIEEIGSPIHYSFSKAMGANVEKLTDGDRILIISDLINLSYPGSTRAYFVLKLSDGSVENIPEETLLSLQELGWYNPEEY